MARKTKPTKSKRQLRWHKSDSWFFAKSAPDLPYWIFLVLGIMALTVFAVWLKSSATLALNPVKGPSDSSSSANVKPPLKSLNTPLKTVTLENASDPSLVAQSNKLYLTFRNNVGGYSVAVYDENLKELESPRWITNGQLIPNQISAKHIFVNQNWYLGYIGGDGYVRLAKYDENFNPQRSITFRTPVNISETKIVNITYGNKALTQSDDAQIAILTADNTKWHLYSSTADLGIKKDETYTGPGFGTENLPGLKILGVIGNKTVYYEIAGTSLTLKLYQN